MYKPHNNYVVIVTKWFKYRPLVSSPFSTSSNIQFPTSSREMVYPIASLSRISVFSNPTRTFSIPSWGPVVSMLARTTINPPRTGDADFESSARRFSMLFLSLCGTGSSQWYNGTMAIGISRPKSLIPVVEIATTRGFFVGDVDLTASRMAVVVFSQTFGSSRVMLSVRSVFGCPPTPLTIRSTTLPLITRASEILAESFEFPSTTVSWCEMTSSETLFAFRRSVSLDGVRATTNS